MSKSNLISIVVSVLSVLFVLFALVLKSRSSVPPEFTILSPQENSAGDVDIKVTPLVLALGEKPQFKIEFNTHSVELDFDVSQTISLVDDRGKNYDIPVWEGSPPGGHHRSGSLSFNNPMESAKSVTLIIKKTGDVPEITFSWGL